MSGPAPESLRDEPVVRRTVVGDWQALRAVRLRAMTQDPGAFGSTHALASALPDEEYRRRAASGASLLAWRGGEPVGIVALVPDDDAEDGPRRGLLTSMWVDPAHRGSGLAARLVEAACAQGRAGGVREVALWVTIDNYAARRLYEGCGFALTGRRQAVRADDPDRLEEEMRRGISLTSTLRR